MANYSLVADYSFRPFTFDEMVKPMLMYKDEYNKRLEDYLELNKNADVFSYLSQTLPEDSKARQLYEGYANAKNAAFEDFSKNGLNINNQRALINLKRRYQGEIGRLERADEALKKERDARAEMRRKDPSMLYANDNINIDDFLDNNEPNLYSISGNDLYTQAANASAKMSSRIYHVNGQGKTLGGYYRDFLTTMGYTPEQVAGFSKEMQDKINADFTERISSIPELQDAAVRLLESQGVMNTATGEHNLTGSNLRRAQQQVIRGLVDGAIYQEHHQPVRDEGVLSAYQDASLGLQKSQFELQQEKWDIEKQNYEDQRRAMFDFVTDEQGNEILDKNGRPIVKGLKEGFKINPVSGKVAVDSDNNKKENNNTLDTALLKLDSKTLRNNNGFDVVVGNDRHHYDYVGALSKHDNKWHHGNIGDDNPGHNFPGAWGWASTSNVENWWGNFSAQDSQANGRVLSRSETQKLFEEEANSDFAGSLLDQLTEAGYYNDAVIQKISADNKTSREETIQYLNQAGLKYTNDIQLIEVPNEKPYSNESGYLIAVRSN